MATLLDAGILKGFGDVFSWLLIFVIVYGALEVVNFLKNKALHALVAFAVTVVVGISGGGINIITYMAPWAVVVAVIIFFVLLLGQFAGLEQAQVLGIFGGKNAGWYIFIPLVIALIIAWTQGAGTHTKTVTDASGNEITVDEPQRGFMAVLTNPKILGMMVVMLIFFFTILLMARGGAVK
jgi:hypothetical protein